MQARVPVPTITPTVRVGSPVPRILRPSPEEDARYDELRRLGRELHVPIFTAKWRLINRDSRGRVLNDWQWWSRTWHRNAYNHLVCQLMSKNGDGSSFVGGQISITDTAGIHLTASEGIRIANGSFGGHEGTSLGYRAAAGEDGWGIVVGSGITPEDFDDFALDTQILDGTGAGQLSYVQSAVLAENFAALVYTVTHQRFFNNNSGGSVAVNEVGLYCQGQFPISANKWMQARDVLGGTISVPDTGQLDVSYDIALTFLA